MMQLRNRVRLPRIPRVVLALLLALPVAAHAAIRPHAVTLAGQVRERGGVAVAGARVLLVELQRAVFTDAHGAFRFQQLAPGPYVLEVRAAGYRTQVLEVVVPAATPVQVTLAQDPVPLEPITLTATRRALSPLSSPLPASAVGREALERDHSISLARTLQRLPGVRTLSTGGEIGKPVIRGLTGARVLVLAQGLRIDDYGWSDEDAPSIDAAMTERVEVVRGPGAVLYGADAMGGVVNVIPRPLPAAVGGAAWPRGEAELGVRSNNRETDVVVRGEGATGAWGWRAGLAGRRAEALHTPAGELENTGFGALTGELALGRQGEWGALSARYSRYGGEFKLLEEDARPTGGEAEEGGPERKLSDDRLQVLGEFPLGTLRLETHLQAQRHQLVELEDDPVAMREGRLVEVEIFNLALSTATAEVLLHHSLLPGLAGTMGASGRVQRSRGSGVVPLIPDAGIAGAGVFLLEQYRRGRLTLLAGLRADLESMDAKHRSQRTFDALSRSAGASVELLRGLTLSANAGTGWRAPTLFELYAAGPRVGEARYEVGDASLDEERSLDLDAGVRFERASVQASIALFRNRFGGFLFIQPTDRVQDGYRVFEYRQADATLTGGEVSLALSATRWLTLSGSAERVRGTNELVDQPLPLMPPRRARLGAELHRTLAANRHAYAAAETELVAAPHRLNPLDIPVSGYQLLDLSAGIDGLWRARPLRLDLGLHNALNERYRDFLSRYKAFALNPGRDLTLRVRLGM